MNAADLIAEFLLRLGVRYAFGVGGANIEDLFAALQRRRPLLRAVLCKHEHAAGTAADAYARLGGGLGVVLVTSGGGAMNLVHALAEARASRVPLLALVGEPPIAQQGQGAFQDTSGRGGSVDAFSVFHALTADCVRIREPRELLAWLEHVASLPLADWTGPRVLLLAKDIQRAEIVPPAGFLERPPPPLPRAADHSRAELARLLGEPPVVVIAGAEVARRGARAELAQLVERLDALVAVAPDARDAFPNDHPRFAGVVGAMGHARATRALERARSILLVGTRLPMGYSYGAAIGAACATGRRVFVVSGDGAFFMHGLEVHTAVEHDLPITYLVLDNAAHGMCLVREQLLLGQSSGYNAFRRSRLGAGLGVMFPGLAAFDCSSAEQVAVALAQCRELQGPCFVSARLAEVEVPPFAAFERARALGITHVARGDEPEAARRAGAER